MDLATRYPIAVPLQRHTAADIASILLEVFCTCGIATKCISDNGRKLTYDFGKRSLEFLMSITHFLQFFTRNRKAM